MAATSRFRGVRRSRDFAAGVVRHIAATPVGLRVRATARLNAVDGRTLEFWVAARDEKS